MHVIGWVLGVAAVLVLFGIVALFAASELVGGVPGPAMRERR